MLRVAGTIWSCCRTAGSGQSRRMLSRERRRQAAGQAFSQRSSVLRRSFWPRAGWCIRNVQLDPLFVCIKSRYFPFVQLPNFGQPLPVVLDSPCL